VARDQLAVETRSREAATREVESRRVKQRVEALAACYSLCERAGMLSGAVRRDLVSKALAEVGLDTESDDDE